jgi:hypothetical protein
VPFRFMWVGDRTPKQKCCMWCQEPFVPSGHIHDPDTGLNYCSHECVDVHRHITERYFKSCHKLEEVARKVS